MARDGALTVMLVDDHAGIRFLARTLIEEDGEGLEVVAEADGARAALAALESVDPDVVVLDARMPAMDGFQAAELIREGRPCQRLVLLTGLLDETTRARATAAGIDVCVSKDELESLPAALRDLA